MAITSSLILPPFSFLYAAATRTRLAFFQHGVLKPTKLDAPVISVGNLTAGGTGKTPLVEYIARRVAGSGRKVCILTRGYGRENPAQRVLVSDGTTVLAKEAAAGDEPLLLAQKLEGLAAVISDVNRIAAGRWAISNLGSEVFVLDDGFQHLQLARDLNVLVVDASNPWGNGRMLPLGPLREPISGLSRADCVVLTRTDQAENLDELQRKIKTLNSRAPLFNSRMVARGFKRVDANEKINKLPGAALAFSGVGNPDSFVRQLKTEGVEPVNVVHFRDHHRYTQGDIDELVAEGKAAGAECLVTTAKDAVKLTDLLISLPCYVLDIEIEIDNTETFVELIQTAFIA
ncbi:MAG TPA: tetraacyldisaccharide 4'-kinase [Pyrinomonadaceae bacterium]|nr:tetraacyldisaccharide 4'-kinase [Pyrinomonadaceae bacterium]